MFFSIWLRVCADAEWSETDKQNSTAMLAKINISLVLRIIYLSSNLFKRASIACRSNPASAAFSQ